MSFDFEKWASERFQGMTHMERNAVETELVVREFRPLIEAARGAVQGIPDGDDGDGSYWLGHSNYLQLKQALRDLGVMR